MNNKSLISCILFSSSTLSFANDPYQACLDKAGVSNSGIIELCTEKATEQYKKQINKAYNLLFTHYQQHTPDKAKSLESAQKAWVDNRNKNCEISDEKAYCLMKMNKQRAEELAHKFELLNTDTVQEQGSIVTITQPETVYIFDKRELIKDKEFGTRVLTFSFSTIKTGIQWLDTLLLKELSNQTEIKKAKAVFEMAFKEHKENLASSEEWEKGHIEFVKQIGHIAIFQHNVQAYYGGNYEVDTVKTIYLDIEKKRPIKLNDLFTQQNLAQLKELVWQEFQSSDAGQDGIEKSRFYLNDDFSISQEGIVFNYGQGSISLSVYGPLEYRLSWDKISPLIKPEYEKSLHY